MITAKISAGSSSIVQDIINMCQSIHSPIGDWQGFVYNSTTGNKPWCVWALRMDEDSHELQYVFSTGLAAPPDGYELITVSCPTTTGFTLSFTSVNGMPSVAQTRNGSGGASVNAQGYPTITVRMSGNSATNLTDFLFAVANISPQGAYRLARMYYKSSAGSQPWAVYAVANTFQYATTGSPPVFIVYTMSGVASPPAGSEQLAIACPSTTTLSANGYTQISVPLQVNG